MSQQAQEEEQAESLVIVHRAHSAVVSAINQRYVALAMPAKNIHRIGDILWQQDKAREKRKSNYADRDTTYKLAA